MTAQALQAWPTAERRQPVFSIGNPLVLCRPPLPTAGKNGAPIRGRPLDKILQTQNEKDGPPAPTIFQPHLEQSGGTAEISPPHYELIPARLASRVELRL